MKKVINGKLYNTDTAKEIGYDNDNPTGNWYEYLYQKKTGEFFVEHWDAWSGCHIDPISFREAQEWVEKHMDGDDYCKLFGDPDEDADDVLLGVRVAATAAAKLKRLAAESGKSQNNIIEELIMNM